MLHYATIPHLEVVDELVDLVNCYLRVVGGEDVRVVLLQELGELSGVLGGEAVEPGQIGHIFAFAGGHVAGQVLIIGFDEALAGHGHLYHAFGVAVRGPERDAEGLAAESAVGGGGQDLRHVVLFEGQAAQAAARAALQASMAPSAEDEDEEEDGDEDEDES